MKTINRSLTLLLLVQSVLAAFKNELPLIVISSQVENTSQDNDISDDTRLWNQDLRTTLASYFDDCRYDAYIIVNQPGISDDDLVSNSPLMAGIAKDAAFVVEHSGTYSDGTASVDSVASYLSDNCGADKLVVNSKNGDFDSYIDITPRVLTLEFDDLSTMSYEKRAETLLANDEIIYSVVHKLPSPRYLIIYGSINDATVSDYTEVASEVFEPELSSQHKTNVQDTSTSNDSDWQFQSGAGLFTNYEFLGPGIIMSLIVCVILATILFGGLDWLASLQVSYKSFEPSAKQQKS